MRGQKRRFLTVLSQKDKEDERGCCLRCFEASQPTDFPVYCPLFTEVPVPTETNGRLMTTHGLRQSQHPLSHIWNHRNPRQHVTQPRRRVWKSSKYCCDDDSDLKLNSPTTPHNGSPCASPSPCGHCHHLEAISYCWKHCIAPQ